MKTLRMVSAGLLAVGCAAVVTVSLGRVERGAKHRGGAGD